VTVWTIYNHGTDGSSLKGPEKAEIVNLFGNNDRRPQFQGKLITEGVGSIGDPQSTSINFTRTPQGGPYQAAQVKGRPGNAFFRTVLKGTGHGVKQNVDSTIEFIRMLNLNNQRPSAINMLGWSRGAVTCIRLAYALYQSEDPALRNIPINIFAVDPVAGAGHSTEIDATTLTPNVRNYVAALAAGEYRRFFKPIAAHRLNFNPSQTDVWVLPMPGNHSDTAKMNNDTGKIVFNLAYRFLHSCSTPVEPMRHYLLRNESAWKLYEYIMTKSATVHQTSLASSAAMGLIPYKRGSEVAAYMNGDTFFPNVHARELFRRVFPITYHAYFGWGSSDIGNLAWTGQYNNPGGALELMRMSSGMRALLGSVRPGPAMPGEMTPHIARMLTNLTLID
jgi:hypothetical protein